MKFYMITCVRGHAGNGKSTDIKFAIAAENMVKACAIARKMPSVKHSRCVAFGKEITEQEYNEYRTVSAYDRYKQQSNKRKCYSYWM